MVRKISEMEEEKVGKTSGIYTVIVDGEKFVVEIAGMILTAMVFVT